jgi:Ca-activated chloride channel family protein
MTKYLPLLLFLFIYSSTSLLSFDVDPVGKKVKDGVKSYKEGNYSNSLENFQKAEPTIPDDKRISYNKGTALYKMGDYKSALKQFEKSATSIDDPELKAKSLYNMGNTHLKMGDKVSAIRSYLDALSVSPDFEAAKKNLDLLHREQKQKKDQQEEQSGNDESKESDDTPQEKQSNSMEEKKDTKKQPLPANEKMKREEAERILESARQDKIKRRKMQSKRPDRNEIFW